jgi:metal-responsive CopG/Arc/MetJ family transcriptional regulator
MRTIVDIPADKLRALDRLTKRREVSRAELIRQAVDGFLRQQHDTDAEDAFGIWRHKRVDGLACQQALRQEWDR